MYRTLLKPLMFRLQPERAHHLTLRLFNLALSLPGGAAIFRWLYQYRHPNLERSLFGLHFNNPVGLAAGFDKDGKHYRSMAHLGFGFIEVGTVTPRPQGGNPQPRLFRLPADEGLINRMGFNNDGVDALVNRLKRYGKPPGLILGGNIGKNKDTPNEEAVNDYVYCFEALFPYVDYFVVNVSSPNTPNLRDLQDKEPLARLLNHLQQLNAARPAPKPILLKIAPDLTNGQLDDILDIVAETGIAGLIATNTTISREGLQTAAQTVEQIGAGGLSGRPVGQRATEVIRYLSTQSGGAVKIIGVGGIHSAADAREKLDAGACLVQVYSALVYEGPGLVRQINEGLAQG
ncbi:quinone-dependent dihydroorotate dehydrogenase [Phaeodactylibacter luteus]|uniref:Dihydroorotate dehydrogenase (quinone) n=1 Tax=Phaeodactylibacter luteus TaxID=1564516 RepID=A0A5C6RLE8_9BACT|nr:quinone-dependent dihydroorotate dehydrogenase [Phaeodactylibacter luteus]